MPPFPLRIAPVHVGNVRLRFTWYPLPVNMVVDVMCGGVGAEGELPARAREATLGCPALRDNVCKR